MSKTAFRNDICKQVVRRRQTSPADKSDRGNPGSQQSVSGDRRVAMKGIQVGKISFESTE